MCYEIVDTMYTQEHPNKGEIVAKVETALELGKKRMMERSGWKRGKKKETKV